jgi:hypothetical protein
LYFLVFVRECELQIFRVTPAKRSILHSLLDFASGVGRPWERLLATTHGLSES